MKSDKVYCERILDCISKIERLTTSANQDNFLQNEMMQGSVILQLILIGELSKRLSEEFKKDVDLPWRDIAGFRDIAIHDYDELKLQDVWSTVENDFTSQKCFG